ncbi:MAG TPA: metalloregulator ArsR/SmtB family transcription factor [Actinomycetota bacterium]|nr:metalloregulator ArsR/SmtB family transcription factor [Actinomycetota bacterium]
MTSHISELAHPGGPTHDWPEYCVHELVDAIGAAQPLVSQHLRVLRGTGLVRTRRRGREVVYELTDVHAAHIVRDAVAHASELSTEGPPEPSLDSIGATLST